MQIWKHTCTYLTTIACKTFNKLCRLLICTGCNTILSLWTLENYGINVCRKLSVQRLYESRQQKWRETTAKPDQQECLTQQAKNRRRRACKSQVCYHLEFIIYLYRAPISSYINKILVYTSWLCYVSTSLLLLKLHIFTSVIFK